MEDKIEKLLGDNFYKIIIDGFVVALCPDEITAKMCYFALTSYKKDLAYYSSQLKEL